MGEKRSTLKMTIIAILLVLVIVGLTVYFFVDLNQFKPQIQAAASDLLNKEVEIKGDIRAALLPHPGITLNDVRVRQAGHHSGRDILSVLRAKISLSLLPLLKRKVEVKAVDIHHLNFYLERDARGRMNIENPEVETGVSHKKKLPTLESFKIERISLNDGDVVINDLKSGKTARFDDLNIRIDDLQIHPSSINSLGAADILRALVFKAKVTADTIEYERVQIKDLAMELSGENAQFTLDPIRYDVFGGDGEGHGVVHLSDESAGMELTLEIFALELEELTSNLSGEVLVSGNMDISAHLSSSGRRAGDFLKGLSGEVLASGKDLTLYHYDIDKILTQYEETQDTDMIDLGALLLAGPFGIALTKGFDAYELRKGLGSVKCRVTQVVSQWRISNGVAKTFDVALATTKNRTAAKGNLDLINRRFNDLVVAVLDAEGCAKYSQTLRGPFNSPRLGKVEFAAGTIKGMFSSLLDKAKKVVGAGKAPCEVFYNGTVSHPSDPDRG